MFQLIVAVISIALVAALAIASIYYGGSAFQKSSLKANVTQLVNGGQQIAGAQALYNTDWGVSGSTAQLEDGTYLASAPSTPSVAGAFSVIGNLAVSAFTAGADVADICKEVAKQAGAASPQFYCSTDLAGATPVAVGAEGTALAFAFKL